MSIPREYGPILDAVRGLTWPARRRVSGVHTGSHLSRLRGRAPELSEYRLYRQGDDPRQLDWKLLARSDRAFTRLSDDRAVHPTWFLVDASASMAFPSASQAKWWMARALATALASIAQRAGDPVGAIIVASGGTAHVRARTRADVLVELVSALGSVTPAGAAEAAPSLVLVPERARLVILSDLLGDAAPVATCTSCTSSRVRSWSHRRPSPSPSTLRTPPSSAPSTPRRAPPTSHGSPNGAMPPHGPGDWPGRPIVRCKRRTTPASWRAPWRPARVRGASAC